MTFGPIIALVPLDSARGALARWLTVFGKVLFFYYVLHIPLIHALAVVVSLVRLGAVSPWLFANHPMGNPPAPEDTPEPRAAVLVWAIAVVALYPACRWFAGLKARRDDWWLRYPAACGMAPDHFDLPLSVAPGDIDDPGHVNNVVYLHWVQDAAIAHWSAAATAEQPAEVAWVAIRHEIDYKHPAMPGDAIVARTGGDGRLAPVRAAHGDPARRRR